MHVRRVDHAQLHPTTKEVGARRHAQRACMQEWSYFRGGLSTIDRDYGIFNKIHHDIGTHVVHHLFPQMPHYNLTEATEVPPPVAV